MTLLHGGRPDFGRPAGICARRDAEHYARDPCAPYAPDYQSLTSKLVLFPNKKFFIVTDTGTVDNGSYITMVDDIAKSESAIRSDTGFKSPLVEGSHAIRNSFLSSDLAKIAADWNDSTVMVTVDSLIVIKNFSSEYSQLP